VAFHGLVLRRREGVPAVRSVVNGARLEW
jgi:hypothetical protein